MRTMYLVFISYNHGEHFNTVVDSVEKVIEVLENGCDAIDQKILDQVVEKTAGLMHEENFYTEYGRGTWSTITRLDHEPTDLSSLTDRETVAIVNALRNYQCEEDREDLNEFAGLDHDGMDDDELDELIERINCGGESDEKPDLLQQSLQDRIRILSEAEAIGHMVCDDEPIQNHVDETSSVLQAFANNIINTLTTNDMIDIIGQRAYNAGVVNSRGNICLTSIHSITASQRDASERCNGTSPVNDGDVFINTEEYDGDDEIVINAAKFGVSYVLAV